MGLFNKKTNTAGRNTGEIVSSFVAKSEGLQRILEKETEYYRSMKVKQAEMLIETKLSLIEELGELKSSLVVNAAALKVLPESEKERLKAANLNLIKAAEDNYNETLKTREVNKLILEAIADAVSQSKKNNGAYSDKGSSTYNKNDSIGPVAVLHNA